jgi:8-oxo-dGTP pyrophosphatase MutT (NUDIX family)
MYYYFSVKTKKALERLAASESFVELKVRRLHSTLTDAARKKPFAVLVVDIGALPLVGPKEHDGFPLSLPPLDAGTVTRLQIPITAVQNLSPYLIPIEIAAGGGVVTRIKKGRRQVLVIYRRGKWDLPKGKLDPGESIDECAVREVREETGARDIRIIQPLDITVHGYPEKGHFRIKTTHWYHMVSNDRVFAPQKEEGIEEVRWMTWKKARRELGYETLRVLLKRVKPLVKSISEGAPSSVNE